MNACKCPCGCDNPLTITDGYATCRQCLLMSHRPVSPCECGICRPPIATPAPKDPKEGPMKRYALITDNSVWLVEDGEASTYVIDRATFGSPYIEDGRRFTGRVTAGELKSGSRLFFQNEYPNSSGDTGRTVQTGIIVRVVAITDQPLREVPEGFIDMTPSWEGIAGLDITVSRQAGKQADRLVSLHDLGRINDDDIRAADVRTRERFSR